MAFRLHLPSKIRSTTPARDVRRGNILVWEQPLADRLRGAPLTLDARMETQSILYRTLWLFGRDVHRRCCRVRSRHLVGAAAGRSREAVAGPGSGVPPAVRQ